MTQKTKPSTPNRAGLRLADLKSHETLLKGRLTENAAFRREWKRTLFARAVGLRVLQYREEAGLTQEQLAEKLDMKQSAVARLELGEVTPSFGTLVRLAEGLEIELLVDISPGHDPFKLVTRDAAKAGVRTTTPDGSHVLVAAG